MRLSASLLGLAALLPLALSQPPAQHPIIPSSSSSLPPSPLPYTITSLTRSLEVSGTITRDSFALSLKREGGGGAGGEYWVPVEEGRMERLAWMEVTEGKKKGAAGAAVEKLAITKAGFEATTGLHWYRIALPSTSSADTLALTINLHYTHLTTPLPSRLGQDDGAKQGMLWEGDLLGGLAEVKGAIDESAEIKVRVKTPTPAVYEKIAPDGFTVSQNAGSSTVIFSNRGTPLSGPQIAKVHYNQPVPVVALGNASRLVEVSHWGNNVAIEDQLKLENRGPALKGTFSRFLHQTNTYMRKAGATSHIMTSLTLQLPPGISSPYYLDVIGNVSTSRFRPSAPLASSQVSKLKRNRASAFSVVELTPRYPLVGGWNYSFTLGWNVPAGEWLKRDQEGGKYVLKVPMFTIVKDLAIDEATLRVRLPEGAKDVQVWTPFPADELRTDLVDKTYLDTTGRPTVLISKRRCTDRHGADVYISYRRSPLASLQKPAAIAAWTAVVFFLGGLLRRLEWKIGY